jgi:hypothetical protein
MNHEYVRKFLILIDYLVDIIILINIMILIYVFLYKKNKYLYLILHQGSIPILNEILKYIGIRNIIVYIIISSTLFAIYRYLIKYSIFIFTVLVFNNSYMIFICIYLVYLNEYSFAINYCTVLLILYLNALLVLINLHRALEINKYLIVLFFLGYFVIKYTNRFLNLDGIILNKFLRN